MKGCCLAVACTHSRASRRRNCLIILAVPGGLEPPGGVLRSRILFQQGLAEEGDHFIHRADLARVQARTRDGLELRGYRFEVHWQAHLPKRAQTQAVVRLYGALSTVKRRGRRNGAAVELLRKVNSPN
jgi:hypothetical protein